MTKQLFPLALGALGIGATEFVVMGLLPDIATNMNISIPQAGNVITAYALGVVVGAPLLVALSSKFVPKHVLIVFMVLFTVFNFTSAIAFDYTSLVVSRFLSGLPHGAFFGIATVVAMKLAQKGNEAKAIATIFTGLTLSNVLMVPLLTCLGHHFIWRYAFVIITLIGIFTILFLYLWLPKHKATNTVTLKEEFEFLKTIKMWHILFIVTIGTSGLFAWFSYIAPLLINISNFDESNISYLMIIAGIGMVTGNILGGYLTDKINPHKVLLFLLFSMMVSLIFVYFFSHIQIVSIILTFLCGALSMSLLASLSIIMLSNARNSQMLASAFLHAAFNLANSLGAFLGGIPLIMGFSYNSPSLVGVGMIFLGILITVYFMKKYTLEDNC